MKRYSKNDAGHGQSRRRGALFHYYMMYLFLTSILLTTAGMCIHSVLKVDRVDSVIAHYMQTLLRLEHNFRQDVAVADSVEGDTMAVTFAGTGESPAVRWSITDNVVKRETIADAETAKSDRFVFARGTQLEFSTQDRRLTLTIQEPSATPDNTAGGKLKSLAKSVQILAVVEPRKPVAAEKAETEAASDPAPKGEQS